MYNSPAAAGVARTAAIAAPRSSFFMLLAPLTCCPGTLDASVLGFNLLSVAKARRDADGALDALAHRLQLRLQLLELHHVLDARIKEGPGRFVVFAVVAEPARVSAGEHAG